MDKKPSSAAQPQEFGYAIAKSLASLGCEVVLNGRTQESVDNALVKLREEVPEAKCSGLVCDFADTSQIDALIADLGNVDILVNNVGIYTDQDFFETSDKSWTAAMGSQRYERSSTQQSLTAQDA
jgi:short-subunit dehydrogenase